MSKLGRVASLLLPLANASAAAQAIPQGEGALRFEVDDGPGPGRRGPRTAACSSSSAPPGRPEPRLVDRADRAATPRRSWPATSPGSRRGPGDHRRRRPPPSRSTDLSHLPAGDYTVQAVFDTNRDLKLAQRPRQPATAPPPRSTSTRPGAGAVAARADARASRPRRCRPTPSASSTCQAPVGAAERLPRPADLPAGGRDPAARLRPRAGAALSAARPHRRLRRPVHGGPAD